MSASRAVFLRTVLEQMGAPYTWNAKGAVVSPYGLRAFDCSGLVTWALLKAGGPDWRATHNTDRLWAECTPTQTLQPGTLVLYGPKGDPDHVMVHVGAGVVLGASGGGRSTTSIGIAQDLDAKVKAFSTVSYRPDLLGYRELPLP